MQIHSGQNLSHYHLIEKIGQGGMGVVWKARDAILGREVAIKLLPADHALDEQRRRMFLEEARLASSVSDAHIVQVFELGREGDLDFIVMEYVEGEPLSRSLTGRPLSPDRVAGVGEQLARALARAHRKKLLHRDIKPGNILVTPEGDVKLVDFGLAGIFRPERIMQAQEPLLSTQPLAESTSAWVELDGDRVFGTLPYMSPEQVRGERLDQRSDIFSLGTVLYEMTTGRRPFRGESASEVAAEIRKAHSRPPRELVPKVPMELDRIVVKSLAARPPERYQTMEDLAVDLRKLGRDLDSGSAPSYGELQAAVARSPRRRAISWAAVAFVLVGLAISAWMTRAAWQAGADPLTILILPLEVRGQTEGAAYVGRAFAEAMAVNLAQAEGIKVLPVPAEKDLGGSGTQDRLIAARTQRAGLMLSGALTRQGESIQADLSLTDTAQSRLIWGTRLNGGERELNTLASSAVRQLQSKLSVHRGKLYERIDVPFGSDAFLASPELAAAKGTNERTPEYINATRRLVQAYPNETYARLLLTSGFYEACRRRGTAGLEYQQFEESAAILSQLDPGNPWEDLLRGSLSSAFMRGDEALERYDRLLERVDLSPRLRAWVFHMRGFVRSSIEPPRNALQDFEEELKLTPLSVSAFSQAGLTYIQLGNFDKGLELARNAYALEPNSPDALNLLGVALWNSGRIQEALPYLKLQCDLQRASPGSGSFCCSYYGLALAQSGQAAESLPILKSCCDERKEWCSIYAVGLELNGQSAEASSKADASSASDQGENSVYYLAVYEALAGHSEEAVRQLRRLLDYGYADSWITIEPWFGSLRGDPEFEAIVAEVEKRLES